MSLLCDVSVIFFNILSCNHHKFSYPKFIINALIHLCVCVCVCVRVCVLKLAQTAIVHLLLSPAATHLPIKSKYLTLRTGGFHFVCLDSNYENELPSGTVDIVCVCVCVK